MLMSAITAIVVAIPVNAEAGQALSISPPLRDIQATPGQTVKVAIKITNISNDTVRLRPAANDFGANGEDGEADIIFDEEAPSDYSLKNWIALPADFILASKESKDLEVPINVPQDAEPGGHYATIRFSGESVSQQKNGVGLSISIGTLVFLQVSGDAHDSAKVEEFFSATGQAQKTGFFDHGPISFTERIKSDGNVHVKPTGTIDIYDLFGRKIESIRVNGNPDDPKNAPRSVLPGSIRRFEQTFDKGWLFGRYEARLNLAYGNNKQLTSSISFWVMPYKVVVLIIVVVGLLAGAIWFGLRRYRAHILKDVKGLKL